MNIYAIILIILSCYTILGFNKIFLNDIWEENATYNKKYNTKLYNFFENSPGIFDVWIPNI